MNLFIENVERISSRLDQIKIIPVLAIESVDDGLRMCEILNRQGLHAAEITFRTTAAEDIITTSVKRIPGFASRSRNNFKHRLIYSGHFRLVQSLRLHQASTRLWSKKPLNMATLFSRGLSPPQRLNRRWNLVAGCSNFFRQKQRVGSRCSSLYWHPTST